ncbi:MAG: hypothetical protein JXB49_30015 [Bacteroidales bacterium]|nr:hypothetical protein [Bacteroidales bacterium]
MKEFLKSSMMLPGWLITLVMSLVMGSYSVLFAFDLNYGRINTEIEQLKYEKERIFKSLERIEGKIDNYIIYGYEKVN